MSEEPQTPAEAARALWLLDLEAEAVVKQLKEQRLLMPGLNRDKRVTYAAALLTAQGPMDVRKQIAEQAVAEIVFQRETCEQAMEGCKDELWRLKGKAENIRAINSNLKEEIRTLGGRYDGHP